MGFMVWLNKNLQNASRRQKKILYKGRFMKRFLIPEEGRKDGIGTIKTIKKQPVFLDIS